MIRRGDRMSYLDSLNPSQYDAVTYTDGHIRIIAGAGSGKTRVITTRIAYLIESLGIAPYRILAITFTNKAANEMKERVYSILGDDASGMFVSTIHSFCVRLLREDIHKMGDGYPRNFTIVDSDDQKSILKEAYKMYGIEVKSYSYANVLSYISACKGEEISPEAAMSIANEFTSEKIKAQVYDYYEKRLEHMKALDFDDLLLFTNRLLKKDQEVRVKWQRRFDYIHVDEFQDVDKIQYSIIRYLVSDKCNLCVVGDPDQTIYTWRGADVNIIMNFEKDFAPVHTVMLNENYRSCPSILKGANSVIKNNKNRIDKDLYTSRQEDNKIIHYSAFEEALEPAWVCQQINKCIQSGAAYRDIAVLYRSNYLSRSLEKQLLEARIPYRIYGGVRFYDRAEIKDALSYLRMLIHDNAAIDLAFKRIINVPKRSIGNKTVETIEDYSRSENMNMYEVIKNHDVARGKAQTALNDFIKLIEKYRNLVNSMSISMLLEGLMDECGYMQMLEDDKETERIENVKELINDIEDFETANPDGTLDEYLQQIALYTDKEQENNGQFVQLMTIHAAKGLEFDIVFVYSMCDGIFPSEKAISEGGRTALEEERRLAYVAFTRARKQLFISDAQGYSYVMDRIKLPSRFIKEIDPDTIEHFGVQDATQHTASRQEELPSGQVAKALTYVDEEGHAPVKTSGRIRKGDLVVHTSFGEGVVLDTSQGVWKIAFNNKFGIRKIMANHPSITKK